MQAARCITAGEMRFSRAASYGLLNSRDRIFLRKNCIADKARRIRCTLHSASSCTAVLLTPDTSSTRRESVKQVHTLRVEPRRRKKSKHEGEWFPTFIESHDPQPPPIPTQANRDRMIQVLFQFAHNGYAIPEEEWELRAVGSVPELGSWDPRCAPSLKVDNVKGCSSAILWLPQGKTVEYRMVLVSKHSQQDGVSTVLWEGKGKHTPYTRRINRRYQPSIKLQASMFKPRSRSSPLTTKVAFVVRKKLWSGTKLYLALNVRNSESHQAPLEMTWKRGDVWSVDADIAIGETVDMTLMLRNDARVVEWEPAVCRSLRVERDSDAALAERYRRRKHLRRTDKVHLVWRAARCCRWRGGRDDAHSSSQRHLRCNPRPPAPPQSRCRSEARWRP